MTARTRHIVVSFALVVGAALLALLWSHLLVEAAIRNGYDDPPTNLLRTTGEMR